MTLVFRNRLDPDNGRQVFLPSAPDAPATDVTTVAQLQAAMLAPGNYNVAAGLYVADLVANVAGVHLHCAAGTILRATGSSTEVLSINADNFSLTGTWQADCGGQLGINIGDTTNTLQSQQPDNVLIDGGTIVPFYIATTGTKGTASRGIACHGSNVTISNCRIENFWREGQEVQALWIHNTNGPITVEDCFLEGAGENVIMGGSDFGIPNAVPSDVIFRRCTMYKRPSWRPPSLVTVKNIFEVKNGQRILVEDSVFDGSWKGAQNGDAIVFTVRNSGSAESPWVIVDDVTFQHNIVRNSYEPTGSVVSILGHDDGGRVCEQTKTIRVINNVFEDNVGCIKLNSGVTDLLLFDHNTWAGDTPASVLQFVNIFTLTALVMTHNVANEGAYGVFAQGITPGPMTCLPAGCSSYTVTGNVWGRNKTQNPVWPSGNTVVGPASTMIPLTAPPGCQLTGAQAGMDAGWDGDATGVGVNLDGSSP